MLLRIVSRRISQHGNPSGRKRIVVSCLQRPRMTTTSILFQKPLIPLSTTTALCCGELTSLPLLNAFPLDARTQQQQLLPSRAQLITASLSGKSATCSKQQQLPMRRLRHGDGPLLLLSSSLMRMNHNISTASPGAALPQTRAASSSAANIAPLANEQLVAKIMRMKGAKTAVNIQVRVVPDPLQLQPIVTNGEAPSPLPNNNKKSVVVSLAQAIQSAVDVQQDLIEISLEQDVPVVTISRVQAILYQSSKKAKTTAANGHHKPLKEMTMQAGIADNDLQRKVLDLRKFLDKGHQCVVTVRAGRKHTWNNVDAAMQAIQRVLLLLPDSVEMVKPPSINPEKNMGQFQVRAKKKITTKSAATTTL